MHEIAGKAVCFKEAQSPEFFSYQDRVVKNAKRLAKCLTDEKLSLVSGGTDNHLLLIDLTHTGKTGKEVESLLNDIGLVVNKNKIPFDEKPATVTSGIRLGTPSASSRGMGEKEMEEIAEIIIASIRGADGISLKEKVKKLALKFPCKR